MKECVMALNMAATLRRAVGSRFSETAHLLAMSGRPRPGHDDACGHIPRGARPGAPSLAVGRWRHPEHARKSPAEGTQAGEADVEADLGYGPLGLAQQRHRSLEPAPLQIPMRCLAEGLLERADEM